jgi:hypothetical protein
MNYFKILQIMIFFSSINLTAQESFYDLKINSISGDIIDFNEFKGKYVLIVNVASNL